MVRAHRISRFVADNWKTKVASSIVPAAFAAAAGAAHRHHREFAHSQPPDHRRREQQLLNGSPRDTATLRNVMLLRWNGEIEVCSTFKGVEKARARRATSVRNGIPQRAT